MLFRRIFIVIKVLGYYGSSDGGQGTSDVGVTGAGLATANECRHDCGTEAATNQDHEQYRYRQTSSIPGVCAGRDGAGGGDGLCRVT